jgi:hypothetical protein
MRRFGFAFVTQLAASTALASACNIGHTEPTLLDEATSEEAAPGETHTAPDAATSPGASSAIAEPSDAGDRSSDDSRSDATSTHVSRDAASDETREPCEKGAYRCVATGTSEREKCEAGEWIPAASCGVGRICETGNATTTSCGVPPRDCDGGPCETCNAGAPSCEYLEGAEDVAVACTDGTPRRSNCRGETPHCVSELGCKACSQTAHCTAEPPACYEYTCTEEFSCELVGRPTGAPCDAGVCNSAHECVECVTEGDCGAPATCRAFTCESGACMESLVNPRSSCTSDHGNLCNEAGECVACLIDNDCPGEDVAACFRAHCTEEGACEPEPLDLGVACGLDSENVCDGAGVCLQCANQSHCDGEAVCHDAECISPYEDVGWFEGSDDAATAFPGFVYLRRLEPLAYPATVWSVGAIARATSTTAIDIGVYEDNGAGTWPEGAALTIQRLEGIPESYQSTPTSSHPALEAGKSYWLGFRVSDDVDLRLSDAPALTYDTGRRVQSGDFGSSFYVATEGDAPGGDSTDAYSVFVIVRYTE